MTLYSIHHPGDASRPYLAFQAQARPVALALLFVMTVGLAAALLGETILWPFVGGTAAAYGTAALVGQSTLHRTVAEVEVRGPFAAVRSVWEAAADRDTSPRMPVATTRLAHGVFEVGVGDTVHTFQREDWPDFDALVNAFREAAREADLLHALNPDLA